MPAVVAGGVKGLVHEAIGHREGGLLDEEQLIEVARQEDADAFAVAKQAGVLLIARTQLTTRGRDNVSQMWMTIQRGDGVVTQARSVAT